MIKYLLSMSALALIGSATNAQPPKQSVNDRVEDLCEVSNVDMVGKRMARQCREQVRAQQRTAPPVVATTTSSGSKLAEAAASLATPPK